MMSAAALAPMPLDSTLLARATYRPSSSLLDLEFRNGAIYRYFAVPAATYQGLLAADSKGSYFNLQIRDGFQYALLRRPR